MGEILGQNLRAIRESKNLTAEEVSQSLGMPLTELQCYEYGIKTPSQSVLEKLSNFYGVDSAELHIADNFNEAKANKSQQPIEDQIPQVTSAQPAVQQEVKAQSVGQAPVKPEVQQAVVNDTEVNRAQPESDTQPEVSPAVAEDKAKQKQAREEEKLKKKQEEERLKQEKKRLKEEKKQSQDVTPQSTTDKELWKRFPLKLHIVLLILSVVILVAYFIPFYNENVVGEGVTLFDLVMSKSTAVQAFKNVSTVINISLYLEVARYGSIALLALAIWNIVLCIIMMIPVVRRSALVIEHKIVLIISTMAVGLLFFVFLLSSIFYIVGSGNIQSYKDIGVGAYMLIVTLLVTFFIEVCTVARTKRDKYIKGDK